MAEKESQIDVVIRFSTSNPDIVLRVETPTTVTTLWLKQQLRGLLQPPDSTCRLRLIHAGKVLSDTTALSKGLHVTLPPPPSRDHDDSKSAKAKGKQPVREIVPLVGRVYIHCSLGDPLTPGELTAETKAAQEADEALKSTGSLGLGGTSEQTSEGEDASTTPAPRGFDRLLSAGFTVSEVSALRSQFLAIQAHTHTPDTMPTGPELLALEERWLDSSSTPAPGGGTDDRGGFGSEDFGGLEDMLYGNLIGFFWPIGAMCWLMREEGVWSRRRQIAVLSGFLVNLVFGFLRVMN